MKIQFNPPRARIVAVLVGAWMLNRFLTRHVEMGTFDVSLPPLEPMQQITVLAIICITIVGLARLYLRG